MTQLYMHTFCKEHNLPSSIQSAAQVNLAYALQRPGGWVQYGIIVRTARYERIYLRVSEGKISGRIFSYGTFVQTKLSDW